MPAAAAGADNSETAAMLEEMLKEGGEINFGGASSSSVGGSAVLAASAQKPGGPTSTTGSDSTGAQEPTQMARDEMLARQLQEEENRRAGIRPRRVYVSTGDPEESVTASASSYTGSAYDSDEELVGEVAAGGWRMREQQREEDVALEEDVSCLEVKRLGGEGSNFEGHCPVCQEPWKEGDDQRVLPCGHGFHPAW